MIKDVEQLWNLNTLQKLTDCLGGGVRERVELKSCERG
jgi:hypothetical protein